MQKAPGSVAATYKARVTVRTVIPASGGQGQERPGCAVSSCGAPEVLLGEDLFSSLAGRPQLRPHRAALQAVESGIAGVSPLDPRPAH